MNFIWKEILNIWNISPNLINEIAKRSSDSRHVQSKSDLKFRLLKRWTIWRIFLYFYLFIAIFRFLLSAYVLKTGKLKPLLGKL